MCEKKTTKLQRSELLQLLAEDLAVQVRTSPNSLVNGAKELIDDQAMAVAHILAGELQKEPWFVGTRSKYAVVWAMDEAQARQLGRQVIVAKYPTSCHTAVWRAFRLEVDSPLLPIRPMTAAEVLAQTEPDAVMDRPAE